MRSARWVIVGAMAVAVLCAAARAEEASVLMQEGVYEQDVAGDLGKAMAVYQKIIANAWADRRYVAEAHFRLGKCYLEKGDTEKAQAEFLAVVQHYADQRKLAAAAGAQLAKLAPPPMVVPPSVQPPGVLKTVPEALSDAVSPDLNEITVTFDRTMMDNDWSWTGGGDTFPATTGKPYYDAGHTTCHLPVRLQPGHVYWVGINSPSYHSFMTLDRVPARRYVILFATAGADGKPTPIPEQLAQQARAINVQGRALPQQAGISFHIVADSPGPDTFSVADPNHSGQVLYLHREAVADGSDVTFAQAMRSEHSGLWTVRIEMTPEGAARLKAATAANKGKRLAILENGACVSAPTIATAVSGSMEIAGLKEAIAREIVSSCGSGVQPPDVLKTAPKALDDAVPPDLKEITVTFDHAMMDGNWSWTGGGDTFPQVTGRPYYDGARTTCHLPVKLQPGHVYLVGVNSPSHRNFKTPDGTPARRYVILFATAGADGKPTPIPETLAQEARQINGRRPANPDKDIAALRAAVETFHIDVGRYPTTTEGLQALVTPPPGVANWHGPYVKASSVSGGLDAYSYRAPGADGKPFEITLADATSDFTEAVATLAALKASGPAIHAAIKAGDAGAALHLMSIAMPRLHALQKDLEGTSLHGAVASLLQQVEYLQETLEAGNLERAGTILEGLGKLGPQLEKMVKQAAAEAAAKRMPDALQVAQRFLGLVKSGKNDPALVGLTVPDEIRSPSEFLPKFRNYFDLSHATIMEFWLADEDACAVTSFFPARQDGKTAAMGIGLRKNGDRWLVRDIDALPDKQKAAAYVKDFRDANPSALQVPVAPQAERP